MTTYLPKKEENKNCKLTYNKQTNKPILHYYNVTVEALVSAITHGRQENHTVLRKMMSLNDIHVYVTVWGKKAERKIHSGLMN
jgi:hypothetical protein